MDFDTTRVPAQAGLWPNILVICGFAFQLLLAMFDESRPAAQLTDADHTLFLVNVADSESSLQVWAVTSAQVQKGCAVCDPGLLDELRVEVFSSAENTTAVGWCPIKAVVIRREAT